MTVEILRACLVDDEPAARRLLRHVLEPMPDIEIVAECSNGHSAIREIRATVPDLVFLDIEMPPPGGFEIVQALRDQPFQLIFTTAWQQYAIKAFETRAIDYLLKPLHAASVRRAIDKIRFQATLQQRTGEQQQLCVNDGITYYRLLAADIAWIEALGRYRRIWLSESGEQRHAQCYLVTDVTLEYCEQQLAQSDFARVHRGTLVNCALVQSLHSESRRHYLVLGPQRVKIPVARRQLGALRARLVGDLGG